MLSRILLFCFFSVLLQAQENTFQSALYKSSDYKNNNLFVNLSEDNKRLIVGSRFFCIGSSSREGYTNTYMLGAGLLTEINDKLSIVAYGDYLLGDHNYMISQYQDSLNVFPGFGNGNRRFQFNIKYKINNFITTDVGNGRHFIGDGYRSLLLSSEHAPYLYVSLTTEFGRIKYYNLYTTFINENMIDIGRKKHSTIHYLDFAITKKIHIGLFESILWQSKSEGVSSGYELAYLNPVIFYRPVEFSKKSSKGNALMGATLKVLLKNTTFYSQFMIDDLNIARRKDSDDNYQSGFFQNKFAFQFGIKTRIKDFNILTEYNQAQPYAYGHRTILQNYSHMNQALAHPLGANFKEIIVIANYEKENWKFILKNTFARVGLDSLTTHYGQNIFLSDLDASTGGQYSYGNFNGQGVLTTINTSFAEVSYSFRWFDVFSSVYYKKQKSDLLDQTSLFYSVGLRNFPFYTFKDY